MNNTALTYALLTVVCWGLYSVLLHKGSMGMSGPGVAPLDARMKSFLLVGVAYVLTAIIFPVILLKSRGAAWTFPTVGWTWSLLAGIAGAVGALFLLMGLSAGKSPAESKILPLLVPAIVFAGAPLVNAVVSITKEGLWSRVPLPFYLGVALAAGGTVLVMKYRPMPGPAAPEKAAATAPAAQPETVSVAPGYIDVTTRRYHVS